MNLGQRRFWQKNKKLLAISVISAGVVGLIFAGYWFHWAWTGFNKTLWDWMQLLIIPVALALVAFLLNRSDQKRGREIAIDNQREILLQSYLDRMSELLLEKKLEMSQLDPTAKKVARARTITTLLRLDVVRKRNVLSFLVDSGLIFIIDMDYVDLSGIVYQSSTRVILNNLKLIYANLSYARFSHIEAENMNAEHTNFSWTDLSDINAPNANLQQSNFSHAHLFHVNLEGSHLTRVDLRGATLNHVTLSNADLSNTDLRGANLSNTDLSNTDLRGANLSNTDFRGATLHGANLHGANLNGAKFRKEDVHSDHLSIAIVQKEM